MTWFSILEGGKEVARLWAENDESFELNVASGQIAVQVASPFASVPIDITLPKTAL